MCAFYKQPDSDTELRSSSKGLLRGSCFGYDMQAMITGPHMNGVRYCAVLILTMLAACGGRSYVYQPLEGADLVARAEKQVAGDVTVFASVLGAEEAEAIFGVPLYKYDIQPVWIKVENGTGGRLRYAPVGTDRFYFSPLEVAWKNRGGFSKDGKQQMQRRFHQLTMERYIPPGESRSGFVFTNLRPGAKGFNVDLFGLEQFHYFTFLLRVPGFVPDYANVDFASIYAPAELVNHDEAGFRGALADLSCCGGNTATDTDGYPINVVMIGKGADLLYALLRANWLETSKNDASVTGDSYLYGRPQDGIFRYGGVLDYGYYELRLWLAPMRLDGQLVWLGQLKRVTDHRWIITRADPDVDNARNFMLQNLWYSQSLPKFGWISGTEVVPVESLWLSFQPEPYFTDGYRGVFWVSGKPVSLLETESADWDVPPFD